MNNEDMPVFGHKHVDEAPLAQVDGASVIKPAAASPGLVPLRPSPQHAAPVPNYAYDISHAQTGAAVEAEHGLREDVAKVRAICLTKIDAQAVASLPPDRLWAEVERLVSQLASEYHVQMNISEQRQLATDLVDDMIGLGPLEPLLLDDSITDIVVNGPDKTFIERGGKLMQAAVHFRDWEHLTNICQRIAASVGRHVDEGSPMVDARLKDGSRVNVVLPPLTLDGPAISIRKFSKKTMDFQKLIGFGSLTPSIAKILEICARCRLNVIVSGGTGSGKTTLMNALSQYIDPSERIVTVEDVAELQLQQPDIVRMETRPASLEGKGEVDTRDLVRNALRMRPDRIIVGEVRGSEAFDMLQAMNTGHAGSLSTIHANSTRDALSRIENMVQMSNMGLSSKSIRTEMVAAINVIVQLDRQRDGVRRVTEVTDVAGLEEDVVLLRDIFKLKILGEAHDGRLIARYHIDRSQPSFYEKLTYFGLEGAWMEAMEEAAHDPAMTAEPL
ncbi:CpaF family protein [Acidocella sp.]|uniref:CpaF family protein n=1 Tax=Acidocella sp. TaxID=50710 RepID=UPI0026094601|nr:CpaF family protein [Acidocella sp.]MDD2795710.1 CpaF family protein [Acidocella sp.]